MGAQRDRRADDGPALAIDARSCSGTWRIGFVGIGAWSTTWQVERPGWQAVLGLVVLAVGDRLGDVLLMRSWRRRGGTGHRPAGVRRSRRRRADPESAADGPRFGLAGVTFVLVVLACSASGSPVCHDPDVGTTGEVLLIVAVSVEGALRRWSSALWLKGRRTRRRLRAKLAAAQERARADGDAEAAGADARRVREGRVGDRQPGAGEGLSAARSAARSTTWPAGPRSSGRTW